MIPAISLLVPCHNAAPFLPRLMESVRAQTAPFAEIIAYDDGSTDETVETARHLSLRILTPNPNRGAAHARNRLAVAAAHDWIHFHDADDRMARDYVAKLAPWCDDAHDVIGCDADWIDEHSQKLVISWKYDPAALKTNAHRHLLERPLSLNNTLIRRSLWQAVGGCDESLAMWEDADIHIRLARAGARFHHLPEVLTWAMRREHSFSHDYRRSWNCRLAALEKYAADPAAGGLRDVLAKQAEKAAAELAVLGDRKGARRAIGLCRRLGGNPPASKHPLIRLLKPFVPALTLLTWQERHRRAASTNHPVS